MRERMFLSSPDSWRNIPAQWIVPSLHQEQTSRRLNIRSAIRSCSLQYIRMQFRLERGRYLSLVSHYMQLFQRIIRENKQDDVLFIAKDVTSCLQLCTRDIRNYLTKLNWNNTITYTWIIKHKICTCIILFFISFHSDEIVWKIMTIV